MNTFLFNLGNEWKTRFENQEEINRQLAKQISMFEKKLDETKYKSKNSKFSYINLLKQSCLTNLICY